MLVLKLKQLRSYSKKHTSIVIVSVSKTKDERTMSMDNTVAATVAAVSGDINETRSAISALINKPKCTDKLLARPPFRFLFDIIVAVNAATDLGLDQVLTEAEMDSDNLKDKSSKLAFLDKVVQHVEARLDTTIDINPKKVIAGVETEKTRSLLQQLAAAATTTVSVAVSGEGKSDPPPGEVATTTTTTIDGVNLDPPSGEVTKDRRVGAPTDTTSISATGISSQEPSPLEDTIAETRASLTSIISKPKITDNLLARPPFRFLFDIIVAVDTATDLGLELVLTADEYESSNVTDKASKLIFLDKTTKHIERKLDTTVDINPKKVVAGLEPEKTCGFLQLLAAAAMLPSVSKDASEDVCGSKDEESATLINIDGAIDKEDEIPDTLNLTSESQFLAIAKNSSVDDLESIGETGVDGSVSITAENGDVEDRVSVETATEEIEVEEARESDNVEINDNGQETGDVVSEDDETANGGDDMLFVDGHCGGDKESFASSASQVIGKKTTETTGTLVMKSGTSIDDDGIEVPRPNPLISSMSGGVDGFKKETVEVTSEATMDLQSTIEAALSVTTTLGQCLGAMDVDAMNEEKTYWNNQVEVETRKLEEYRRQQDATVLAPLLQKIEALDREIVEKEKEVDAMLERIGDDESD